MSFCQAKCFADVVLQSVRPPVRHAFRALGDERPATQPEQLEADMLGLPATACSATPAAVNGTMLALVQKVHGP